MKYILAILACADLFMLYAILGREVFGWKHGGGVIPVFILLAFVAATWRGRHGFRGGTGSGFHFTL